MFNRNNKTGKTSLALSMGSPSILSASATIIGTISIEEDLRIDGIVEGDIESKGKVIVGTEGCMKGNIKSGSVDLMGKMFGNAIVSDIVILRAGSFYEGQITAHSIEIEAGAHFYGNCKMGENAKQESLNSLNLRLTKTVNPVLISEENNQNSI